MARHYVSPARAASAARTRQAILRAARSLLREGGRPSVGAIASLAGVSRLSVYHHFGSTAGVGAAVAGEAKAAPALSRPDLRSLLEAAVRHWATDPPLFRRLPEAPAAPHDELRDLTARLATEDRLRPGCSIKEVEDVLSILTSFSAFDRLHQDGRRSTVAVTEILVRMAGSILNRQS